MFNPYGPTNHPTEDVINESGLLYRTQYLVLNRTMLEAMPVEWQKRFVALGNMYTLDREIDSLMLAFCKFKNKS